MPKIRILVADDHALVRAGFLLSTRADLVRFAIAHGLMPA